MTYRIYFIVFTASLLCNVSLQDNFRDNENILQQLATDFKGVLIKETRKQYAVLYIQSNAQNKNVDYKPVAPNVVPGVVYPMFQDSNYTSYPYSYSAMTPDFRAMFRKTLGRNTTATIHTEDLALNLIFPLMKTWFEFKNKEPVSRVYLYTFYRPCLNCETIIENFLKEYPYPGVSLHVGFSELVLKNESKIDAEKRYNQLKGIMQKQAGYLYHLNPQIPVPEQTRTRGKSVILGTRTRVRNRSQP